MSYILVLFLWTADGWIPADDILFPPLTHETMAECEYAAAYWNKWFANSASASIGTNVAYCTEEAIS